MRNDRNDREFEEEPLYRGEILFTIIKKYLSPSSISISLVTFFYMRPHVSFNKNEKLVVCAAPLKPPYSFVSKASLEYKPLNFSKRIETWKRIHGKRSIREFTEVTLCAFKPFQDEMFVYILAKKKLREL